MIMKNKFIRIALIILGSLFVLLSVLGVLLPLLPTTPFLLLAVVCYSKSSNRLHNKLLNSRFPGNYIRNYYAGNGIPMHAKLLIVTTLWLTMGYSYFFVISNIIVKFILILIALGVTIHLLLIKTSRIKGI